MEEKKEFVCLARIMTEEESELMYDLLHGKEVQVFEQSNGMDNALSDVDARPDISGAGTKEEVRNRLENASDTRNCHGSFVVGDCLSEVCDGISVVATSATSEEAYDKLEDGEMLSREETFACDRTHMIIVKIPAEEYDRLCKEGKIGTGTGEYGTDYEKSTVCEAILGNKALSEIVDMKGVLLFGPVEDVYAEASGEDFNNLFADGPTDDRYGYNF